MKRLNVSGRDLVVVFGAGPVGCSVLMLAKSTGCHVSMVEVSSGRREFAKALGADEVFDPVHADVIAGVMELTKGRGADVAIDTSGAPSAQSTMLDTLAYWGRAAFVGMQPGEITVRPNRIIERQLTIIGSAYWPMGIWGEMTRFILDRKIPIERMVSCRLPLGEADEAFRVADAADGGKVAFVWPD